jgi:lysophospholipase L1-like esterase
MFASVLAAALLAVAAYDGVTLIKALQTGQQVAAASEAYQQRPARSEASLLVVGDSTGVGTGAEEARHSLAGRLGSELPTVRIDNLAQNGAKTGDVTDQLRAAPLPRYDAILVQVGGNDALRFTSLEAVATAIDRVLALARAKSDYVALMSTGDLGEAPAMPWPVSGLFSWRSRAVRDRFAAAAAEHGIDYVDLFAPVKANPFAREPDRYYAPDGLHLSGAGYAVWYDRLRESTKLPAILETPGEAGNKY